MTMACNYIVNALDIEDKSYLELGVRDGLHFQDIKCKVKTSVDISCPADFKMSTDEFFEQAKKKQDVRHHLYRC